MEVAVVSSKGESCSASIWNPVTGSVVASYTGGGECHCHGLSTSGGYVVCSEVNKPMLHAWPLNKQHKVNKRLIAPGKITCVAVSPDSNYVAVSVDCKLHVYQTASGVLCGTGGNHFQPINVVKFNSVGTLIGCGGEDGLLTLWRLGDLVQLDRTQNKPFISVNVHSLPITDLVFTGGDLRCRVITVSLDRSCKIHDVSKKEKLFSGHFENQLTCVALCPKESCFYLGDSEGQIREVVLTAPPRKVTNHYSNSGDRLVPTKFHESRINSMSVSLDCNLLMSGSDDSTIKIIHVKSRQCVQTIRQKGPVTNCFFSLVPSNGFSTVFKPSLKLRDFASKESLDGIFSFDVTTPYDIQSNFPTLTTTETYCTVSNTTEVDNLKRMNNDLYLFAVEKLLGGVHSHRIRSVVPAKNSKRQSEKTNKNTNKKKNRKRNKLK